MTIRKTTWVSSVASVAGVCLVVWPTCAKAENVTARPSEAKLAWANIAPPEPTIEGFDTESDVRDNDASESSNRDLPLCSGLSELRQRSKALHRIRIDNLSDGDDVPPDCSTQLFRAPIPASRRTDGTSEFSWRPANLFHYPLYFDNVPLERYGQSRVPCLEPVISGCKFLGAVAAMPYNLAVDRPHDCVTSLGLHRPGNCVPCTRPVIDLK